VLFLEGNVFFTKDFSKKSLEYNNTLLIKLIAKDRIGTKKRDSKI
jgi:hypothetical protein